MNRGVLIHGVLLAIALILGYQTLAEDDERGEELGDVAIWKLSAGSIQAVTYTEEETSVRIERREQGDEAYLWGIETRQRRGKRDEGNGDHDHGHDHGEAEGHDHDHGEAEGHDHDYAHDFEDGSEDSAEGEGKTEGETEGEEEDDEGTMSLVANGNGDETDEVEVETVEFPVGSEGDELFELYAELTALRDLGVPDDDQRESFRFADAGAQITVHLEDGTTRVLEVGGRVYGGADRYIFDGETGKAYVVRSRIIRSLRGGQSALRLRNLHAFEPDDVTAISVDTGASTRELVRLEDEDEKDHHHHQAPGLGDARWAHADTADEPSQTLANFIGRVADLRPRAYEPEVDKAALQLLLALRYRGKDGGALGELELYRDDEAGEDGKPAYYVWSERTRVLGEVSALAAERIDQDLEQVFAGDPGASPREGGTE